jgi:hypothetical protein
MEMHGQQNIKKGGVIKGDHARVCVCVSIGPTTMSECIQNSLFQNVIETLETTIPAMFGKIGLPLFIETEAKISILFVRY